MPRQRRYFNPELPYHVYARTNNREWFSLPTFEIWKIFLEHLNHCSQNMGLEIYGFTLMQNHYHMICGYREKPLGQIMHRLQRNISQQINRKAQRMNHVFGGVYSASAIQQPEHFAKVMKYIAQNPVRANLCKTPAEYNYSSFGRNQRDVPVCCHLWQKELFKTAEDFRRWIGEPLPTKETNLIRNGVTKPVFQALDRVTRRDGLRCT